MDQNENTTINQVAILTLSLILGTITPLLTRRTYDGVFGPRRKSLLHQLNAMHNLLFYIISLSTIIVKIFVPTGGNCWTFRFVQGIIFHLYVFNYELVLGLKAKAIIGSRIIHRCADLSVGTILLLISLSLRFFTAIMSIWTADYVFLHEYGLCVYEFKPTWQGLSNYTRNILEIFWSALFVIPLYRVVRNSKKAGAIAIVHGERFIPTGSDVEMAGIQPGPVLSKNAIAMRHLLVASMIFPFCASLISIALSIYMNLEAEIHPGWGSIMHGIQNYVSTLSLNLILNQRVDDNNNGSEDDKPCFATESPERRLSSYLEKHPEL